MRLFKHTAIALVLAFVGLCIATKSSYAKQGVVIPGIMIAPQVEARTSQEDLDKYKSQIIKALKEVQGWYKEKTGKTYQIDEGAFFVERPTDPTIKLKPPSPTDKYIENACDFYGLLRNPLGIFPGRGIQQYAEPNTIKVVYVLGSSDLRSCGIHGPVRIILYAKGGIAVMSHMTLLNLSFPQGSFDRAVGLSSLAHEMGHALGLVDAGHAKSHTCSIGMPEECRDDTPKPLPGTDEFEGSVMSYGGYPLFPNVGLNNSLVNPEIWKLYQTEFVNPEKTPAPKPKASVIKTKIQINLPDTAYAGDTVNISGFGFGADQGALELYNPGGFVYKPEILSWSDDLIKIKLDDDVVPINTNLSVSVRLYKRSSTVDKCRQNDGNLDACNAANCGYLDCSKQCWTKGTPLFLGCKGVDQNISEMSETDSEMVVVGKKLQSDPLLNITVTVTCGGGDQVKPVQGTTVQLLDNYVASSTWVIETDENGKGVFNKTIKAEELGKTYFISAGRWNDFLPLPGGTNILTPKKYKELNIVNGVPQINREVQFNYLFCKSLSTPGPSYGLKKNNIHNVESYGICSQYSGDLKACDNANCSYFMCTNECLPDGLSADDICARKDEAKARNGVETALGCENKYYWDSSAKDGVGACIHKIASDENSLPPNCDYIFPIEEDRNLCSDAPLVTASSETKETIVTKPGDESDVASTSAPTPEAAEEQLESITISNHDDFRTGEVLGNEGSQTITFAASGGEQSTDWNLLSTTQNPPVYVRKVFTNDKYEDVQISVGRNSSAQVDFLTIHAKQIRKVTEILVNGQSVDINNPELPLHLEGTEGQDQDFTVPVLVRYSNGDEESADLHINYRPEHAPASTPTPTTASSDQSTPAPGRSETTPVPGQETTPVPQQSTPAVTESPAPVQTCDNIYYWDENANACIHKHTDGTYPDCEPYNFTKTSDNNCPDKP